MRGALLASLKKSKKLKKTKKVEDRSAPMLKGGLEKKDIENYLKDVQDTYVEEWEPLLTSQGLTFRTEYVPMEKKEAQAMVSAYEAWTKLPEAKEKFEGFFKELTNSKIFSNMILKLQAKIDTCLKKFKCDKVFVKGSSRSAKDSVIEVAEMRSDFTKRVIAARDKDKKTSLNDAVIALLGAGKDAMSGTDAKYFLKLFIRSERIYQDMTLALDRPEFKSGWAIREWSDIDIGMEFRGFVHERRFCALCQYDYLVKIDALQDKKTREKIVSIIQDFYKKSVAPALHGGKSKFKSYIADFAIDTKGKCWIIELNPFQESTDGAMFSWAREKKTLTSEPFEFRYQAKTQSAAVALSKAWRELVTSTLQTSNQ
ncbi:hypothetical protein AAMO2058_000199000 [Amorphochlora amoebiformis]